MRQVVQSGPITPADELRDVLALSEKRIAKLRHSGADAVDLLRGMDRIADLWPELEARGMDLRAEAGRWETVQKGVRRQASLVLEELAAAGGVAAVRRREQKEGAGQWWWNLDVLVRERNRRRLVRAALSLAVVAVVGVAVWLALRVLFPVDPILRDSMRAKDAGDALYQQNNDLAGALAKYRRAAEIKPDDTEAWLRMGVLLEKQGDAAGAANAFDRARALLGDESLFYLARGGAYFTLGVLEDAERDLLTAIDLDATNPYSYYYLASIYEERGQAAEAVGALEQASKYSEERGDVQLTAMARYRMGLLMQARMGAGPTPTVSP